LLDLTVTPRPKDAGLLGLALPLDIGGTLAHPTVTPNRGAIVKGLAGAVASAPIVSAGGDDGNACLITVNQPKKTLPAKKTGSKG
jgi:hypothetical protein